MKKTSQFSIAVILLLTVAGCGRNDYLPTEYGKVIGEQGGTSVNGTSILYGMFREKGFQTKRFRKISPRLKRFGTIIWFPDDYRCPSQEVVDELQAWLDDGYSRTLIYVGRDFDAQIGYFEQLLEVAGPAEREELNRSLAEAKLSQDSRIRSYVGNEETQNCDWFQIKRVPTREFKSVSGPLAADTDQESARLEFSTILESSDDKVADRNLAISPLLSVGEVDFVYSIAMRNEDSFRSQLIVVNNGSFLLNFGLVNRQNRVLAGALIDQCQSADVAFLESGPNGVETSNQDAVNHNSWAWIAKPPLRYIVPHFLLWGVLFCFVFFPIFGRPRKLNSEDNVSFRNHISAMGKLLQKSKQPKQALAKVREYQAIHAKDTNLL